jgi:hypothetical protein
MLKAHIPFLGLGRSPFRFVRHTWRGCQLVPFAYFDLLGDIFQLTNGLDNRLASFGKNETTAIYFLRQFPQIVVETINFFCQGFRIHAWSGSATLLLGICRILSFAKKSSKFKQKILCCLNLFIAFYINALGSTSSWNF